MEITLNHVPGRMSLHASSADVVPHPGASLPSEVLPTLVFNTVLQILVSRKRPTQVRVVRNGGLPPWDVLFQSTPDRDAFINAVSATGNPAVGAPGRGTVKTESCQRIEKPPYPDAERQTVPAADRMTLAPEVVSELRGAVHVFEAINILIDPTTLQLRAITEQMESDILRQLPALAQVYAQRVESDEDRRAFWEAVVRKYFCFSRSFLDAELPTKVDAGASIKLEDSVNAATAAALPAAVEQSSAPFDDDFDSGFPGDDEGDDALRRAALLPMVSWRKRPRCMESAADINASSSAAGRRAIQRNLSAAQRLPDLSIQFQVPENARNDKVLRHLKLFWTNVATGAPTDGARKALQDVLGTLASGSVMHRCATAAIHHAQ